MPATAMKALSRQELERLLVQTRADVSMDRYHRYSTPHGVLPSVTTVIKNLDKPALLFWASKIQSEACEQEALSWAQSEEKDVAILQRRLGSVRQAHKDFSRRAADMGTEGHKLAELEFRRRLGMDVAPFQPKYPREAHMVKSAILEWADGAKLEPMAMEQPLYTDRYAGTLDLIGYEDGVLTIFDFKSSDKGRIYREAYLQNMALRGALGLECAGRVIVVPRDGRGEINPVPIPWDDATYKAFLALIDVHLWGKAFEKAHE